MQTHGVIIKVAIMSLLVSGLGITGCTGNIERSDFASIKVGATRQTIESLLGKPVKSVETYAGTTDTYRYNIVRSGSESDTSGAEIAVAMLNPTFYLFWPILFIGSGDRIGSADRHEEQGGEVDITYDLNDMVTFLRQVPQSVNGCVAALGGSFCSP